MTTTTEPKVFRIDTRIPVVSLVAGGVFLLAQAVYVTSLINKMDYRIERLEGYRSDDKKSMEDLAVIKTTTQIYGMRLDNLESIAKSNKERIDDLTHAKSFDRSRK